MAPPVKSAGGRDQSKPEIAAMNKPDRLGMVRKMVPIPRSGVGGGVVSDKRTVKQKLEDAGKRKRNPQLRDRH